MSGYTAMQKHTMPKKSRSLTVALCILLPFSAWAHHSALALYELDKEVVVKGVVKRFRLVNPHTTIELAVTDPQSGTTVVWTAEGDGASVLKRQGWTPDQFKVGEGLVIQGHPARSGKPEMAWISLREPGGKQATAQSGSTAPTAETMAEFFRKVDERRREERRRHLRQQ